MGLVVLPLKERVNVPPVTPGLKLMVCTTLTRGADDRAGDRMQRASLQGRAVEGQGRRVAHDARRIVVAGLQTRQSVDESDGRIGRIGNDDVPLANGCQAKERRLDVVLQYRRIHIPRNRPGRRAIESKREGAAGDAAIEIQRIDFVRRGVLDRVPMRSRDDERQRRRIVGGRQERSIDGQGHAIKRRGNGEDIRWIARQTGREAALGLVHGVAQRAIKARVRRRIA